MKQRKVTGTTFLWAIYILILAVLLPHTVWMFAQFEPTPTSFTIPYINVVMQVSIVAVAAAIGFELGVGALTHKLVGHVNDTKLKRSTSEWGRFKAHYLNVYGFALALFLIVSAVANLTHAYHYASPDVAFLSQPLLKWGFVVLYGLTLPFTCAVFVAIIAKTQVVDDDTVKLSSGEVNKLQAELKFCKQQIAKADALMKSGDAKVIQADKIVKNISVLTNGSKTEVLNFLLDINPNYTRVELASLSGASATLISNIISQRSTKAP